MIFVTGSTGLVGNYLLHELSSRGKKVRALVRPGYRQKDLDSLFDCFSNKDSLLSNIEWVEGDITDFLSIYQALEGVSEVYHCAALVSFDPRDKGKMIHTNVEGTANVVNACIQQGIKKFCHVSSIASLGRLENNEIIDETAKWKTSRRNSGYSVSKFGAEREVWRGMEEGLKAVIVNPSVILGAGCTKRSTNPLFNSIEMMLPFYNQGINGYVDVRDVVNAMVLLMESEVEGERFILNSENLSLQELFTISAELLGKRKPFIPVGKVALGIAWRFDWLRSRLTGSKVVFSKENTRSAMNKSSYSSDKFREKFGFTFIPVKQSLEYAFRVTGKIR